MRGVLRIGCLFVLTTTLGLTTVARANPVQVGTVNDPIQDDWTVSGWVEELGLVPPFPANEAISSLNVLWEGHVPCLASSETNGTVQVRITNLTPFDFTSVFYVADPQTTLVNWDERIYQVGFEFTNCLAFQIDSVGENTPLVYESIIYDNIFQAGETWEFVIQAYANSLGGPPEAFDSLGVAGASSGWPPSTGSIIAIPEPATVALLALGGLALLWRRRI